MESRSSLLLALVGEGRCRRASVCRTGRQHDIWVLEIWWFRIFGLAGPPRPTPARVFNPSSNILDIPDRLSSKEGEL